MLPDLVVVGRTQSCFARWVQGKDAKPRAKDTLSRHGGLLFRQMGFLTFERK
jgi:hypothetical protein